MNDRLPNPVLIISACQQTAVIQREYRTERAKRSTANTRKGQAAMMKRKPVEFAEYRAKCNRMRVFWIKASRTGIAPEILALADAKRRAILDSEVFVCTYCTQSFPPGKMRSVDHVLAAFNGGKHVPENLTPACRACNSRKSAKLNWVG